MSIIPMLWFDNQAKEAAQYYIDVLGGRLISEFVQPNYAIVEIEIQDQKLTLINAGPHHEFNDAVSLQVFVDSQEEINRLTEKLSANGGHVIECGWVNDQWGFRWQIVPTQWMDMVNSGNEEGIARASAALMQMKVLNIEQLEQAFNG